MQAKPKTQNASTQPKIKTCIKISILVLAVIAIAIAAFMGAMFWLRNRNPSQASNMVYLGKSYDPLVSRIDPVFQSYEDMRAELGQTWGISSADFTQHNYAYVAVMQDECGEKNFKVLGYKVEDNIVTIQTQYESRCGVCAPSYYNYLIPLDKKIANIHVEYDNDIVSREACDPDVAYKPIIYLYPEQTTEVTISLGHPELLTTTYPKYENNWHVVAEPSGNLTDLNSQRNFYGLYWEGKSYPAKIHDTGFVVKGEESAAFLEEKLAILGLTEREADEFIIYWLPKLEQNTYNYIYFETGEKLNGYMPLEITPQPENVIRVIMEYLPLTEPIMVTEQDLNMSSREGFVVVEWGGSLISR